MSAGLQKFTTGEVNWKQAAVDGVIGAVTGGVGGSLVRQAVVQTVGSVVSGMADRGLNGGNVFDPRGLGMDVLMGGVAAVPGGRLGAGTRAVDPPPTTMNAPLFSQTTAFPTFAHGPHAGRAIGDVAGDLSRWLDHARRRPCRGRQTR